MIALILSRSICQMLRNFSGDEFKRTAFEFKKEKESRFLDFAPSIKSETRTFMVVQLRPKKCTKKVCCTCKVVDARSRCHHRHLWWSFLVTPTNHNTGNNSMNQPAGRRRQAREKRTSGNCDWVWFRSDWLKKWREIFEPIIKHDTEAFLRQFSLKYFCPETNAAQAASQS